MIGNRPSSLPIAQYCAKAPALNVGAGRAAACSSVWHARAAGHDWKDAYARLTEEEQEDIDSWLLPTDIYLADGVCLRYADALKETECGLDIHANHCLKSDPKALTAGNCDFHWLIGNTLYVADLKKSQWTTADGPNSLQILCYALALAAKYEGVEYVCCGIWHATEGTWSWGDTWEAAGDFAMSAWERVKAAALHTDGDFATGPHCRGCYSRSKCPAYLVPPDQAHGSLVKYLTGTMTSTEALELKFECERVDATLKTCKEALKAFVVEHGPLVDPEAGKQWVKSEVKGKMTLDKAALEADHPELVQKYMRPGKPHERFDWRNLPKEKK